MPHDKVIVERIELDRKRHTTERGRFYGLMRKLIELKVMCDTEFVCMFKLDDFWVPFSSGSIDNKNTLGEFFDHVDVMRNKIQDPNNGVEIYDIDRAEMEFPNKKKREFPEPTKKNSVGTTVISASAIQKRTKKIKASEMKKKKKKAILDFVHDAMVQRGGGEEDLSVFDADLSTSITTPILPSHSHDGYVLPMENSVENQGNNQLTDEEMNELISFLNAHESHMPLVNMDTIEYGMDMVVPNTIEQRFESLGTVPQDSTRETTVDHTIGMKLQGSRVEITSKRTISVIETYMTELDDLLSMVNNKLDSF